MPTTYLKLLPILAIKLIFTYTCKVYAKIKKTASQIMLSQTFVLIYMTILCMVFYEPLFHFSMIRIIKIKFHIILIIF